MVQRMTRQRIINRILNEKHNPPRSIGSLGRAMRRAALEVKRGAKRA